MARTPVQHVELFHLLFLDQLGRKVDRKHYVLKGGCNLRFFFKSIRYSEDMDIDVQEISAHVLREKVNAILRARPFAQVLESYGLGIEHVTEAKQTDTTQRWKFGLQAPDVSAPLPTKIEFSRRGVKGKTTFDAIDRDLNRAYALTPILANHYDAASAFQQKVGALVMRSEIQARDVFDLEMLSLRLGEKPTGISVRRTLREHAQARALSIDYAAFKSQVLAYLSPDDQARYGSADDWEALVLRVVDYLEGLPS